MKIHELIAIADQAYPDGCISQCWDAKLQRPVSPRKPVDGLARFCVVELSETFDPKATDEAQRREAARVMQRAADEVQRVANAFAIPKE